MLSPLTRRLVDADRQVPLTPAHLRAIASGLSLGGDEDAESEPMGAGRVGEGAAAGERWREEEDVGGFGGQVVEVGGGEGLRETGGRGDGFGQKRGAEEESDEGRGAWGTARPASLLSHHMVSVTNVAGNTVCACLYALSRLSIYIVFWNSCLSICFVAPI